MAEERKKERKKERKGTGKKNKVGRKRVNEEWKERNRKINK